VRFFAILDRCESIGIDSEVFMRSERIRPVDQAPGIARKGPQLVPPQNTVPSEGPALAIETGESHPIVTVLIAITIAFTGAVTFFGSVVIWLLVRNTGVNWLFQGFQGR
jgi:hypothetical protein